MRLTDNVPDEESSLGDSHRIVPSGHQGIGLEMVMRVKSVILPPPVISP